MDSLDRVVNIVMKDEIVMNKRIVLEILGGILGIVNIFLILMWFDWRLLLVILLAVFSNNLSQGNYEK